MVQMSSMASSWESSDAENSLGSLGRLQWPERGKLMPSVLQRAAEKETTHVHWGSRRECPLLRKSQASRMYGCGGSAAGAGKRQWIWACPLAMPLRASSASSKRLTCVKVKAR
jgi:hypothetical protein